MNNKLPRIAVLVAGLAVAFVALPIVAVVVRAPWSGLAQELTSSTARRALGLSLVTASVATAVAALLGLPLAWALASGRLRLAGLVRAVVVVPMVLPPVVGGVALLLAYGRRGLLGGALDLFGVRVPFTVAAVVLAQAFVAFPFFVVTVEAGIRGVERRYVDAAETLGASPWFLFRTVVLPLAGPSLLAGTALTWARAIGEFGATVTFAGNLPGRTQTLPLAVFLSLESGDIDGAVSMSLLLLAVSVVVLVGLRNRWLIR